MFTKAHPAVPKSHRGRLHRALGLPENQPLTVGDLAKAMGSKNKHMREMGQMAKNMRGWSKK